MAPESPSSSRSGKSQRVLACVLCQQRKVKCDRKFPCANCIRAKAQCVPATLIQRQRKRRFPERELLDRLRRYEDLLRQNDISFEAGRNEVETNRVPRDQERIHQSEEEDTASAGQQSTSPIANNTGKGAYKARNFWHAVSRGFRDNENESDSSNDDVREATVKKAWVDAHDNGNHLLFGTRGLYVDLALSHPNPVQIFRLWQTYLDNVDPLLKVTHTPSLQGRVIEAASDLTVISPTLEALLFGIYCISILSLSDQICRSILGSSKEDSLTKYQIACQQALANCGFLHTDDRDCLTALFFYLVTIRHNTVPPIVSTLFGVAIRIAHRMGIHNEHDLAKCSTMEAEMRRRLWWALVLFDSRIGELANTKPVTLDPTWDCKIPLNVNDADLRPELKTSPDNASSPTEALFTVLRSEVGQFMRYAEFHLEYNSPGLRQLARHSFDPEDPDASGAVKVEKILEDKYLQFCDDENPLQFMAIWSTRSALAKCRLLEHHAKCSDSSIRQTDALRNTATTYAIKLLQCDSTIMSSPLVTSFTWLNHFHFPFPAYIHIIQDLKRRPSSDVAPKAWEAMSDNFEPWLGPQFGMNTPFFTIFTKMVLEAWEICETANAIPEGTVTPPKIVSTIRETLAEATRNTDNDIVEHANIDNDMVLDEFQLPSLNSMDSLNYWFGMGVPASWATRPEMFSGTQDQTTLITHPGWLGPRGHSNWLGM